MPESILCLLFGDKKPVLHPRFGTLQPNFGGYVDLPIDSASVAGGGAAQTEALVVAAVDLGSNSFHMLVAHAGESGLQVIDRLREPVRLASGLLPDKTLSEEAEQRALDCLRRFGQRLKEIPPSRVRVVGTNTLRRLRRSRDFLAQAETCLGHRVEIIAGVEEARLIYGGVTHGLSGDGRRRLVVDIGGGSTELIIGQADSPQLMRSVHMGCVSWTQQCFADGRITRKRMRQARLKAAASLKFLSHDYMRLGWDTALGASGSVRSVLKVSQGLGLDGHTITRASLRAVERACIEAGQVATLDLPGLREDRRDVFVGSVTVLGGVFKSLGIEQLSVSDRALREGLVYDLLGRLSAQDVRDRSAQALSKRFKLDQEQAARVETAALALLAQVATDWKLKQDDYRDYLRWAAQLHEVGMAISHAGYHKHSAYVLAQVDLPGFSRTDQQILAAIVRGHRGKWSDRWFKELPRGWRKASQRLAILLRIAVILNRGRTPKEAPPVDAWAHKKHLQISLPEGWLDEHALTRTDLEQDAQRLQETGFALEFV